MQHLDFRSTRSSRRPNITSCCAWSTRVSKADWRRWWGNKPSGRFVCVGWSSWNRLQQQLCSGKWWLPRKWCFHYSFSFCLLSEQSLMRERLCLWLLWAVVCQRTKWWRCRSPIRVIKRYLPSSRLELFRACRIIDGHAQAAATGGRLSNSAHSLVTKWTDVQYHVTDRCHS